MATRIIHGYALSYDLEDGEPLFTIHEEKPPEFDGLQERCVMLIGENAGSMPHTQAAILQGKLLRILESARKSAGKVINDTEIERIINS